ncbi:MAG: Crp/Fnr family transcriptional regulator [Nonlabens sp.]
MNLDSSNLYGFSFEPELKEEIQQVAVRKTVDAGKDLIKPQQFIKSIPLVLKGNIKILRSNDEGEELLLYHIEAGETFAVTLNCCLGHVRSEIHAVTETTVEVLMIPVQKMEEWSSKYKSWRHFIFNSYHKRMMELLESLDNIAFHNMEERLEMYLLAKKKLLDKAVIDVTHKEIATDLHTSRVVISRLLKKMERERLIKLHRGSVELL